MESKQLALLIREEISNRMKEFSNLMDVRGYAEPKITIEKYREFQVDWLKFCNDNRELFKTLWNISGSTMKIFDEVPRMMASMDSQINKKWWEFWK